MSQKSEFNERSKMGLSHRTYVENLLKYYRDNDIQQGDPNEGVWHQAHYPQPKHLGGTQVILLLEEHHAVQGVLQSEEYQSCCVYGWEKKHLDEQLLEKWLYWMRVKAKPGWAARGKKSAETNRKNKTGVFDPEVQKAGGRACNGRHPARLAGLAKARTPEHQSEAGKRGGKIGGKVSGRQRWQSSIDPSITSNAAGVVRAHQKRGWDPDKRILLNP